MKQKSTLLYMTGLSIDKKRMNQISSYISMDKDYVYWLDQILTFIDKAFSKSNQNLKSMLNSKYKSDGATLAEVTIETIINTALPLPSFLKNSIVKEVFQAVGLKYLNKAEDMNEYLSQLYTENKQSLSSSYKAQDFFSIYLSHQSDSLGVGPLSTIAKSKKFNLIHSYCDRDFFDNKYIDSVILKFNKKSLKNLHMSDNDLREKINEVFLCHCFDLILSRILADFSYEIDNKMRGFYDFVKADTDEINDVKKSLSERNLFGVSLFSSLLSCLNELFDTNVQLNKNENTNEFLNELWAYSSQPDNKEGINNVDCQIYYSNGKHLIDDENNPLDTNDDDYFKTIYSELNNNKKEKETLNERLKKYIHVQNSDNNSYIKIKDNGEVYIKVPIKMILSLPLDKNNKASSSILIPYGIDDGKNINILTVGGAEHNRALAHLINRHREEYQDKRIFGYMDNQFDFLHKLKYKRDANYNNAFLMGLNQPVSGYNSIFRSREDTQVGESIAIDSKLFGFSVKDNNRKVQVLAIYGFSASTSKDTLFNFIASTLGKKSKGVFYKNYIQNVFELGEEIDIKKGLSSKITFRKDTSDIIRKSFNNKNPLYIFQKERKTFRKLYLPWREKDNVCITNIITKVQKGKITDN